MEIANAAWVRARRERVTPSKRRLTIGPWINVRSEAKSQKLTLLVIVQVDVDGLPQQLANWGCPTFNRWPRSVY